MSRTIPHVLSGSAVLLLLIGALVAGCSDRDPFKPVNRAMLDDDLPRAIEEMQKIVAERPDDPETLFRYGSLLILAGQPGGAEWPLRKAMEDPEWFVAAGVQVAEAALAGNNTENAAAVLREILEREGDNVEARLMLANALAGSPRTVAEAIDEVERILAVAPDEVRAYKPLILAQLGLEEIDAVEDSLAELGELIAGDVGDETIRGWHCSTSAIFANDRGDHDKALELWTDCEERYPTHPNVVEQSLVFHNDRGEYARSLEIAQRAFEQEDGTQPTLRPVVADLLRTLGRPREGADLLRAGIEEEADPAKRSRRWTALASYQQALGDREGSVVSLQQAVSDAEAAGDMPPTLRFALADMYTQLGRYDEALATAERMTIAAQRTIVRARVAQMRGEHRRAIDLYEEVTRLWASNPFAPYHSAHSALAIGDLDRALDDFFHAIRIDDAATDARAQAAILLEAQGRLQMGIEVLGRAKNVGPRTTALVARSKGLEPAWQMANSVSREEPQVLGLALEAAADRLGRYRSEADAFAILERGLAIPGELEDNSELSPDNLLPILRALPRWAPDLASLERYAPRLTALEEQVGGGQPLLLEVRGSWAERAGDTDRAVAAYQEAISLELVSAGARLRWARLVAPSDPAEALEILQPALDFGGLDADLLLSVAQAWPDDPAHLEGRIELLTRALELAPTHGPTALELAVALDARPEPPTKARMRGLLRRASRLGAAPDGVAALEARWLAPNAGDSPTG